MSCEIYPLRSLELHHVQVWKKSIGTWLAPVPQAPILLRPGAKRHPTEKGRIHRGNDRQPAIFQGKKCEDLTHKDGRLEIQQKWKFVSPKIGICHWLIYVRRLLNIKLCEMVHPQLHEDITRYGTHYCRWKSGRQNWIQPSKIRWKLTRFWATRGPKIWKSIGRIISSVW